MNPILENVKKFVEANPGSTWWLEELLFRGAPADEAGGKLKGAHVKIGMRYTGPDGEEHAKVTESIPVGNAPTDVPVGDVLSDLHLTQQTTVDVHEQTIKDLNKSIEDLKESHKQELESAIKAHNEERVELMKKNVESFAQIQQLQGNLLDAMARTRA